MKINFGLCKTFLLVKFLDQGNLVKEKSLWKVFLIKEKCWLVESFFVCGKTPWLRKSFGLWKSFLLVSFFDQEKILSCRKLSCLWKNFLFVKIFACGKFSWSWKNIGLPKTFLIMEKSSFAENARGHGKFLLWRKNN